MEYQEWKLGKCRYFCILCEKIFCHSVIFYHHVEQIHGFVPKQYKKLHENPCIKLVTTTCELCDKNIPYDLGKLKVHIGNVHKIELEQYYNICIKNSKIKVEDIVDEEDKVLVEETGEMSRKRKRDSLDQQGDYIKVPRILEEEDEIDKENNSNDDWINLSEAAFKENNSDGEEQVKSNEKDSMSWIFQTEPMKKLLENPKDEQVRVLGGTCQLCKTSFQDKSPVEMDEHFKQVHQINLLQYYLVIQNDPRTMIHGSLHTCAICSNFKSMDESAFKIHVRQVHGLTKAMYDKKYEMLVSNKESSSVVCPFCDVHLVHSYSSINFHVKLNHKNNDTADFFKQWKTNLGFKMPELKREISDSDKENENLATKGAKTIAEIMPKKISKSNSNGNFVNKCLFACKDCKLECNSRELFETHTLAKHGMAFKEYFIKFGDPKTRVVNVKCQICNEEMKQDAFYIKKHLELKHYKVTLNDYISKYSDSLQ